MIAVITADLIDSSSLKEKQLKKVLNILQQEFRILEKKYSPGVIKFEVFRGDSFQGIVKQPEEALYIVLQLKAALNRITIEADLKKVTNVIANFKVAIGIGEMELQRESVTESNGQAFQFSGRTLDEMKNSNRKTALKTPFQEINSEFDASFFLLDLLMDKWSTASAEVVYYLLLGYKEQQISEQLKISQSAVNQRKKASAWEGIAVLLERYRDSITKMVQNE